MRNSLCSEHIVIVEAACTDPRLAVCGGTLHVEGAQRHGRWANESVLRGGKILLDTWVESGWFEYLRNWDYVDCYCMFMCGTQFLE